MGFFWEWANTSGTEPIESVRDYCRKIWLFLGYAFAHIAIGAANILVLAYGLKTGDIHGFFCTLGWQFFASEAILVVCYTYCNPVYPDHRRVVHMFLNIVSLILITSGSVLVLYIVGLGKTLITVHGLVGFVSFACTILISLVGPFAVLTRKPDWPKALHGCLALPTYIGAALSLITGIMSAAFQNFVGGFSVVLLIMIMIAFYVSFISVVGFIKIWCTCKKVCKRTPKMKPQPRPPQASPKQFQSSQSQSQSQSKPRSRSNSKTKK